MLLDSSGLFAYFSDRDPLHREALRLFTQAPRLLTHSYLLAELVPLFQIRRIARRASLNFQTQLTNSKNIEIV